MNLASSPREKVLLFITILSVVLFIYWTYLLNPLLVSIDKTSSEVQRLQNESQVFNSKLKALPVAGNGAKGEKREIYSREKQLSLLVNFIAKKFRWFGIGFVSMDQAVKEDKIVLDIEFKSSYYQFLGFFNSLSSLEAVFVIESVDTEKQENRILTRVVLSSSYEK